MEVVFMNNYYAHAISVSNFKINDFKTLERILKSGYLMSRNAQRKSGMKSLSNSILTAYFNGMDYISLCDLSVNHDGNSSYDMYIRRGLSLLIDRDITVIKPILIGDTEFNYFNTVAFCGKNRYSNLVDEVQVKDKVSLEHLKALSLSLSVFSSFHDKEYLTDYLKYTKLLLEKYNYDVSIYNLDDGCKIKLKK